MPIMVNHGNLCLYLFSVCSLYVCVCHAYLNGLICCGTCSSALSFRTASITAIPLTFSTKTLQERTRVRTHTHTHTDAAFPYEAAKAFLLACVIMQDSRDKRACGQTGCVCEGPSLEDGGGGGSVSSVFLLCTQTNQIAGRLCSIFTSHTVCMSLPPPSAPSFSTALAPA